MLHRLLVTHSIFQHLSDVVVDTSLVCLSVWLHDCSSVSVAAANGVSEDDRPIVSGIREITTTSTAVIA